MASRVKVLRALPNVQPIQLDNAEQIDWPAVGWKRAQPPIPLIYLGTPGPCRKAVVHLVDASSGRCEAIVKIPIAPEAKDAIVREADVLAELAEELYPFSPRLLHLDRERGIATQHFIPGTSGSRRLRPEYFELLRSLVWLDEPVSICQHVANWRQQGLPFLGQDGDFELLESALDECCDAHPVPSCRVHGDFSPWNIRRRSRGAAALIDWEESEDVGLPLQDPFHFLHMQDFLFHSRARAHSEELVPFAGTLGIEPQLCRKLEIAYLADAYIHCCSRADQQRAEFLRRTLALIIRDRPGVTPISAISSSRLRLVSSHRPSTARGELFDAMIAQLNQAAVPYCILSGYESSPQANASDVDIMFHPRDLDRIPDLLAQTARSAGALLVQAIQHETTACYFVLAKEDGKHIAHLDADCYSDYRRDGRTWLLADNVLADRRRYRAFYVPSIVDEFTYYLIKKVLKQSIESRHLKRLQHLFARSPGECRKRIAKLWPGDNALLLERAIVEQRLPWFETNAVNLLFELRRSPASQGWVCRRTQALREVGRLLRRIAFPTGLSVVIVGGDSGLRSEIADGLICDLAPAFRRTRRIWNAAKPAAHLVQIIEMWAARFRSTLVVREDAIVVRSRGAKSQFTSNWIRQLAPCDFVLDLRSGPRHDAEHVQDPRFNVLCVNSDEPSETILEKARKIILHFLALRTESRLELRTVVRDHAIAPEGEPVELRSQGLD